MFYAKSHIPPIVPMSLAIALLAGMSHAAPAADAAPPASKPQVIILKLDDITKWISPRWHRVADYLEENQIKASFGIICQSLEIANPETIGWIKERQAGGLVEFWLHGYTLRGPADKGEFEQGTFEEQKALLEKSERLAKDKLGFELRAFGPHWSETTKETLSAVNAIPEIKIYLYGPKDPGAFHGLSLPRVLGLENPTFIPDFDKFKAAYDQYAFKENVLVLQGHPDSWSDDKRWDGFTKIIDYLKAKGCVFMTPSEYLATLPAQ